MVARKRGDHAQERNRGTWRSGRPYKGSHENSTTYPLVAGHCIASHGILDSLVKKMAPLVEPEPPKGSRESNGLRRESAGLSEDTTLPDH
jgi:hypothetical protein